MNPDLFGNDRNAGYKREYADFCSRCIGAFGLVLCAECGGYGEVSRIPLLTGHASTRTPRGSQVRE